MDLSNFKRILVIVITNQRGELGIRIRFPRPTAWSQVAIPGNSDLTVSRLGPAVLETGRKDLGLNSLLSWTAIYRNVSRFLQQLPSNSVSNWGWSRTLRLFVFTGTMRE